MQMTIVIAFIVGGLFAVLEETIQMKTIMAFLLGVLVGAYAAGQVWQEEAIKRGFADNKNNQFKWKEVK